MLMLGRTNLNLYYYGYIMRYGGGTLKFMVME